MGGGGGLASFVWHSSMRFCEFSLFLCVRAAAPPNSRSWGRAHDAMLGGGTLFNCKLSRSLQRTYDLHIAALEPVRSLRKDQMTEGSEEEPWFVVGTEEFRQLFGSLASHSVRHDLYRGGVYFQSQTPCGYIPNDAMHRNAICAPAACCPDVVIFEL